MGKDNERPNCKSFACQADRKAKLYVYGGPYTALDNTYLRWKLRIVTEESGIKAGLTSLTVTRIVFT
jgi:hypothetical protein